MRAAGELVEGKGGKPSKGMMVLKDLIGRNATQRASAWERLSILSEAEIDIEQDGPAFARGRAAGAFISHRR
jgi:hypothetical protein